jgi:hypothetical protein
MDPTAAGRVSTLNTPVTPNTPFRIESRTHDGGETLTASPHPKHVRVAVGALGRQG